MDKLNIRYSTSFKALPPQVVRIKTDSWAGVAQKMEDGSRSTRTWRTRVRPWQHCLRIRSDSRSMNETTLTSRLDASGIRLPAVSGPFGAYVPARRTGNLVFVAGQLPTKDGKLLASGQVPSRCSIEQAQAAARQCVVNALAAAKTVVPDLNALVGVVRVGVFVSSDIGFTEQPKVANGASELLLELFGDPGQHARAAVGVNTLPLDAAVEVEFLFEVRD